MRAGVQAVGICLLLILAAPASAATGDANLCTHGEREATIAACGGVIQQFKNYPEQVGASWS